MPMWVADMDFRTPDFIMDALRHRCEHEVLGYAWPQDSYWQTMCHWLKNHYCLDCKREELHFIPGIVAGISFVLQAMTQPGDGIMVTTPVYPPFLNLPQNGGRRLVCSPLKIVDGRFAIDFEDLEWRAHQCQWLILSNPHNPGGTVWTKEELAQVADICLRKGVLVISDEIHADLTYPQFRHTSFATVSEAAEHNSITFFAPSKTFNMAGLQFSNIIIRDEATRDEFKAADKIGGFVNPLSLVGQKAAYDVGGRWHEEMKTYLDGNFHFLKSFLEENLPEAVMEIPEATYLAWVDLSAYFDREDDLPSFFAYKAGVLLEGGDALFVGNANRFIRLNLAMPRSIIQTGLERMRDAILAKNA